MPTSAPRATQVWHRAGLAPWVGKHLEPSHPKLTQNPKHSAPTQRRGRGGSRAALSPSSPFARARAGPSQPPSPLGTGPPPSPWDGARELCQGFVPPPSCSPDCRAECAVCQGLWLPFLHGKGFPPPSRRGCGFSFRLSGNGASGDYREGGTQHSCRHPPASPPQRIPHARGGETEARQRQKPPPQGETPTPGPWG